MSDNPYFEETDSSYRAIAVKNLQEALKKVPENFRLVANRVGNLTVLDVDRGYAGWICLRTGEVTLFDDEEGEE